MSARSMVRNRRREAVRESRRVARRAALTTGAVLGAGAFGASAAGAADFPVTNTNDSGAGSLRAAITGANGAPGPDTVSFAANVTGSIVLSGAIPISGALEINGPGPGVLTVNANDTDRIFTVGNIGIPDRVVSISGLRLTNGNTGGLGGAIYNEPLGGEAAELTIANCVVTSNRSYGEGGAIASLNGGSLTITNSAIRRNSSSKYDGGGVYVGGTGNDQPTEVTIAGSEISNNFSGNDGGGLMLEEVDAAAVIRNSTISGNSAQEDGGGIQIGGGAGSSLTVDSTTVSDNSAFNYGGGVFISDPAQASTITDSTIEGNSADIAAGLAVYNTYSVPISVLNSTIANNDADDYAGGVFRYGGTPAPLTISSSIVAGNSAPSGGPDLDQGQTPVGQIDLGFSVIGDSTGAGPVNQLPAGTNRLDVDPQLGPLADNGGPTETMLPALASPAVDSGTANGLAFDQRGLPRTVDQGSANALGSDGTDAGSVELADGEVAGAEVSAKKTQKQKGKKIVVAVTAGAAEAVSAEATGSIKAGQKSYPLKGATAQVDVNGRRTLKLKPRAKPATRKIARFLAGGRRAKAKVAVTLTDAGGNSTTDEVSVKLKS